MASTEAASSMATGLMAQVGKKVCGTCAVSTSDKKNDPDAHTCGSAAASLQAELQSLGERMKVVKQATDARGNPLYTSFWRAKTVFGVPVWPSRVTVPVMNRLPTTGEISAMYKTNPTQARAHAVLRRKIIEFGLVLKKGAGQPR
jgi:hypothetical protein